MKKEQRALAKKQKSINKMAALFPEEVDEGECDWLTRWIGLLYQTGFQSADVSNTVKATKCQCAAFLATVLHKQTGDLLNTNDDNACLFKRR